jgi:hypothetical protein
MPHSLSKSAMNSLNRTLNLRTHRAAVPTPKPAVLGYQGTEPNRVVHRHSVHACPAPATALLGPVPGCELAVPYTRRHGGALVGGLGIRNAGRLMAVLAYRDACLLSDKALNRRSAKASPYSRTCRPSATSART